MKSITLFAVATTAAMLLLLVVVLLLDVVSAAEIRQVHKNEAEIEARRKKSDAITIEDVTDFNEKAVREHLTWRGEVCADCTDLATMRQVLKDHVTANTPTSAQQYTDTSAALRKHRHMRDLGDNPRGNHPNRPNMKARQRRHQDPNDPLASLKNVLNAHGLDAHTISGNQDLGDFLDKQKKRKAGQSNPDL